MVRNRPKASARAVGVAVALSVAFFAGAEPVAKKFIGTGWDTLRVSPEEVLANASLFADSGLDGINLTFSTKNDSGEKLAFDSVFSSTEFKYDDLKHYVPVFQKIAAAPGLTETLLTVWWTPRPEQRLKWTDDAGWKTVANNMAVMTKLAKEGGLKGLFLDWEDYGKAGQFTRKDEDPEPAETLRLARQRGREIGTAVFGEYPDVRFFSYWWLCTGSGIASLQADDRAHRMRTFVWGAFVDGLMDVLPDGALLIDGREHYHLESFRRDFYKHSADIQVACQALLSPENREKYRRAVSVSFGHYIDMYVNDKSAGYWYYGPEGGSRLEHFRRNIEQAARAATEYVWVYGEKGLFVPYEGCASGFISRHKTWEELLPGWKDAVKKVKSAWAVEGGSASKKAARASVPSRAKRSASSRTSSKTAVKDGQGDLPKKFIACGASIAKLAPKDVLARSDAFAALGFDGVAVSVDVTDATGRRLGSEGIASRVKFSVSRLRPFISDLKKFATKPGLKESLLYVNLSPEKKDRLPWGAEKRWSFYVYNMGMMAKLAKAAGLKGLFLDPRDVNGSCQFAMTEKDKYGYAALVREARRRGRAVGKAVFTAYPDIVLFSTRWFSAAAAVAEAPDAAAAAKSLWPAFVDGILESMPATATFVDGCAADAPDAVKRDYYKLASDTFAAGRTLAAAENVPKLLGALSLSAGDTLARYTAAKDVDAFWRNLAQAAAVSAEYVWLDVGADVVAGEGADALDGRLPGWRDVVPQVKDERAWIRAYLEKNAGTVTDLVRDSACANGVGGGFFAYIDKNKAPHAVIDTDTSVGEGDSASFRMKGCGLEGTLMFRVQNVKPGDAYIVQFSTKGYPVGSKAAWREDSKFRWNVPSVDLPVAAENAAGWRTASRIVRAPEMDGYNEMYLMIDMRYSGTEDLTWVDNVHVFKIK